MSSSASLTTIRWPVDAEYEVMQTPEKDARVRVYLDLFFGLLADGADMQSGLMFSEFEADQESERRKFILDEVRDADQYHGPPDSVLIGDWARQPELGNAGPPNLQPGEDVVLYKIGMNKIRSDPYTGMAMLYAYLYSGGMIPRQRKLLLWMPNVPYKRWADVAKRTPNAKHIRLYRVVADGVLFADQYLPAGEF